MSFVLFSHYNTGKTQNTKKGMNVFMNKPLVLMILDGYGIGKEDNSNAIYQAKTPNIDKLVAQYPNCVLGASGMDVGLPEGQMGNSEVGHTNIGAGRIVYQDLTRITKSINDGNFNKNTVLKAAMDNAVAKSSALHLMGLLSDGGVHSHTSHLRAIIKMAKEAGVSKVFIHCFTDGRDVAPSSAVNYLRDIEDFTKTIGLGSVATVSGRYYAMDRDNRWERVKLAYDAIVNGVGEKNISGEQTAIDCYGKDITDEFIMPTICTEGGTINNGDSVVFFNFRPDRARELTAALTQKDFDGFDREKGPLDVNYVCLTRYDSKFENVDIAFAPQSLENTLGEYLANNGKTQLRIAETEKYAHVTFFFNGGREQQYTGEDRVLIESPKVATYDLKPEMSAVEVTTQAIDKIKNGGYDVIILNLANCDMVGHTGIMDAAINAVEVVDECVGKLVEAILSVNGIALITSDHGNADVMLNDKGEVVTSHSTNLVPLIVAGYDCKLTDGVLADLSPTMLEMMGLPKPSEMEGSSLIVK